MRWISWVPQISSKESQYQERPFYFKFPREYSPVQVERKIQRVRNYTQSKRPWDTPCGRSRWFYFKKVQTVASKGIQRLWKESWLRLQQSSINGELHKITWRRFDGTKLWRTSLRLKPLQRSVQVSSKSSMFGIKIVYHSQVVSNFTGKYLKRGCTFFDNTSQKIMIFWFSPVFFFF